MVVTRRRRSFCIAPWWNPEVFDILGNWSTLVGKSNDTAIKVWEIQADNCKITYIKTGIGAPVLSDAVLALTGTKCKKIVFVGSVGALDLSISIGDIVIPRLSICGDGMSRYLKGSPLKNKDPFGEMCYPDSEMFMELKKNTKQICDVMVLSGILEQILVLILSLLSLHILMR